MAKSRRGGYKYARRAGDWLTKECSWPRKERRNGAPRFSCLPACMWLAYPGPAGRSPVSAVLFLSSSSLTKTHTNCKLLGLLSMDSSSIFPLQLRLRVKACLKYPFFSIWALYLLHLPLECQFGFSLAVEKMRFLTSKEWWRKFRLCCQLYVSSFFVTEKANAMTSLGCM